MPEFTCRSLIRAGFRRAGLVGKGRTLSAEDSETGLETLQRLYTNFVSTGLLGKTEDYLLEAATYTAKEGQRITSSYAGGSTLTLPVTLNDPDTNVLRTPLDGSFVVFNNTSVATRNTYIYDAYVARWLAIEGLALDSVAPMYARYGEGLTALLAVLLADEQGNEITSLLKRQAGMARLTIASRYDQVRKSAQNSYM